MKMDIVWMVILILFGVIAGNIFLSAVDKTMAHHQDTPVIDRLNESLGIQRDLQAKLNYRTGDVAAQLARMDDQLIAIESRLAQIEDKISSSNQNRKQ